MNSSNASKCLKIIKNSFWTEHRKIEKLKRILHRDPACVFQCVYMDDETQFTNMHTLLHVAVYAGFAGIVKLLLDHGADVHSKNGFGEPPIFAACNYFTQRNVEVLKLLIEYGADVNVQDGDGETPLLYLVMCRHNTKIIEVLLSCGAKATDKSLFCAITYGNWNASKLLIKHLLIENPDMAKPFFLDSPYCLPIPVSLCPEYWDECKVVVNNEISSMKETKLGNSTISIYDIFAADERKLAHFMQNEAVQEFIISNYITSFPIHAHIIKKQCQKGMVRMIFENQGHVVMNHWQPSLFDLGIHQRIFEQLDIQDLKNLREAGILAFSAEFGVTAE